MNQSILRACIGSADDGQIDREACVRIMTIQFFLRMMLVGSRWNLIGILGALRIWSLILTLMGICVTNGAWVGVETDGVVVVGKTGLSLGVCTDGNYALLIGTCWLWVFWESRKICFGGHNDPRMRFGGPFTEFDFHNLSLSRNVRNDVLLVAFYQKRGRVRGP